MLACLLIATIVTRAQGETLTASFDHVPLKAKRLPGESAGLAFRVMETEASSVMIDYGHPHVGSHVLLELGPVTSAETEKAVKTASRVIQVDPNLAPIVYVGSLLLMALGICWMFKDRGLAVSVPVVLNVLALSTMSLLIRNIFVNAKFQFPAFVTGTHAFATALIGIITDLCRNGPSSAFDGFPDARTFFRGVVPVGLATGASLGLANMGLWYSNAHFYEMLGSSGFLVTAGVGVLMGQIFEWQLLQPMLMLTLGTMILSFGEMSFSAIGAVCILSATVCRAAKAQTQGILMSPSSGLKQLGPVELVTCTSVVSLVIMLLWSAAVEGREPWKQILNTRAFVAVLLAALNAAVLNIASIFVIRSLGPVAQQCVGQLKSVLCCVGAVAAFGESITYQQVLGYSVVISSIFWYNHRDMVLKASRKATQATETTVLKPSNMKV